MKEYLPLIIVLVSAIIAVPLLKWLFKRTIFLLKLRLTCSKKGYYVKIKPSFFFAGIHSDKSELTVETGDAVFSIKMVGVMFRKNLIKFIDPDRYAIRRLAFQLASTATGIDYEVKRKPRYDYYSMIPDSQIVKKIIQVIVVCPTPMEIRFNDQIIANGDMTSEALLYTSTAFVERIKNGT